MDTTKQFKNKVIITERDNELKVSSDYTLEGLNLVANGTVTVTYTDAERVLHVNVYGDAEYRSHLELLDDSDVLTITDMQFLIDNLCVQAVTDIDINTLKPEEIAAINIRQSIVVAAIRIVNKMIINASLAEEAQ